jgi:hypothetical protein
LEGVVALWVRGLALRLLTERMAISRLGSWSLLCVALLGCSAGAQKPAISAALDDPARRKESFEATLRVLDEHPDYVDEFVLAAEKHPKTLDRFLTKTASELRRDEFARFVAVRLTADEEGLKQILIACLDEASDDPAALKALSEAMAARPQLAAIVVVQSDASLRKTLHALLQEVLKNPDARRSFLAALAENSDPMAQIIAPNPKLVVELVKAFARVGLAKGEKEASAFVKALE